MVLEVEQSRCNDYFKHETNRMGSKSRKSYTTNTILTETNCKESQKELTYFKKYNTCKGKEFLVRNSWQNKNQNKIYELFCLWKIALTEYALKFHCVQMWQTPIFTRKELRAKMKRVLGKKYLKAFGPRRNLKHVFGIISWNKISEKMATARHATKNGLFRRPEQIGPFQPRQCTDVAPI